MTAKVHSPCAMESALLSPAAAILRRMSAYGTLSEPFPGMDMYSVEGRLGEEEARVRFRGPFEGKEVVWNARIATLAAIARAEPASATVRNFLEVSPELADGSHAITIGLSVQCIDAATVRKTIIMVRQYKRLRTGRHEYGPTYHADHFTGD